jgi:hypothetical protein
VSAKGRKKKSGEATETPEHEFYPTPAWCTQRLLQHVELPGGEWLEPSAGDGAIIRAVNAAREDVWWDATELRAEALPFLESTRAHVTICDFLRLAHDTHVGYHVALGNPPFSLAAQFVLESLKRAEQVVMLLRLNFLGSSNDRRNLFEQAGMPDVYVLPERPSFTGNGTDACEYAWMRWIRGRKQKSEVRILFEKSQTTMFGDAP